MVAGDYRTEREAKDTAHVQNGELSKSKATFNPSCQHDNGVAQDRSSYRSAQRRSDNSSFSVAMNSPSISQRSFTQESHRARKVSAG